MKMKHRKDEVYRDFEKFAQIHILLLQLSGLLSMGQGWGYKLARNLFSIYSHLNFIFISTIYVLCIVAGKNDVATIGECVCALCAHSRYIVLYCHRNHLMELLRACCELWAELSHMEKDIVR